MRLTIDSQGEELISRDLFGMAGRAADVRPAMVEIRDLIWDATSRQFASEGAFGSGGWEPLASSTVEAKERAGLDRRILHATLRMERSVTGDSPESIAVASRDGLDMGSSVPYTIHHQTGTDRMPRRRPMQLPDRVRQDAPRIVVRHVRRGDRGVR
jgi:hypothetical protein